MKINDKNRISTLRTSIKRLVEILNEDLLITDDAGGSEIKSSVRAKKNAFVTAKSQLAQLQRLESNTNKNIDYQWYLDTINDMVMAAEKATDELTKVSKKEIQTNDTNSGINGAIDANRDANTYWDEFFTGVQELNDIVKSIESGDGLKIIDESDFKSGFAERYAYDGTLFYKPKERAIAPGYNKELDAIVISYDGTVGDIIDCYGLRIALPKAPTRNTIQGSDKAPSKQWWERPRIPEGLNKETAHQYLDVIDQEFTRRDEGYWFMNNGKPEYVTGAYYMLLTHLKTDAEGGYFHFRKAHMMLLYFLEAAWVDERSLGTILGKTRRTGATFVALAFALTKGISMRDVNIGMTSKKDTDAKKMFERLVVMFKNMTFFFKPLNTGEGLLKEISFITPSIKTTKNNQKKETKYEELGTKLNYEATTEDSYDSTTMKFYIGDEFSKWSKGNILNHWSKVRKTLTKGSRIHGKAFILSTVEYVTGRSYADDDAKSGDRFKWLYYESDVNARNANGMTPEGLYKIFIPATDNYEGHIDRYGNCIADDPRHPIEGVDGRMITRGARTHIIEQLQKYKSNISKYNDEKRKDPITEEEMFRIASENALFNITKLQDQIEYNDKYYLANGQPDYIRGNFKWVDEGRTRAAFYETPHGRFMVNWIPDQSMCNESVLRNGKAHPKYDYLGMFGIDPYKFNQTVDGKGSKGAIIGWLDEHPVDGIPKNQVFLVYLTRPQTLDVFFEDAMMAMTYYGMAAAIERNIDELLKVMHRRGMSGYAVRDTEKMKLSDDELRYGGINSVELSKLQKQAHYVEKMIEDHMGYADDDQYRAAGEIGVCPFNDLLIDLIKFNILDRTKYDATVALCLAVYYAKKHMLKNANKSNKKFDAASFYDFKPNKPNRQFIRI